MTDVDEPATRPARNPPAKRGRRAARVAGVAVVAVLALGVVAVAVVYSARGRIGVELATRYFAERGVPARIVIKRLDFDGFIGSLSLGAAKDPDFVVDQIEVDFAPAPIWRRTEAPTVRAVRLNDARLKGRYANGKLTFGSLQPLIDEILSKPSTGPLPGVTIRNGRLTLATPVGAMVISGDGDAPRGRLASARLILAPTRLAGNGLVGERLGGEIALTGRGERIDATFRIAVASATAPGAVLREALLTGMGQFPYPQAGKSPDGPVDFGARLAAGGLVTGAGTAEGLTADVSFEGAAALPKGASSLAGAGGLTIAAARVRQPGATLTDARAELVSERFTFSLVDGRWRVAGVVGSSARAGGGSVLAAGYPLQLRAPSLIANGEITAGPRGTAFNLIGEARTSGGFAAKDAEALTASLSGSPEFRAASAAALRDFRLDAPGFAVDAEDKALRLALRRPLTVAAAGGRSLVVAPRSGAPVYATEGGAATGAFDLAASGGGIPDLKLQVASYRVGHHRAGPTLDAQGRLEAAGSLAPVRDASLGLNYRLTQAGGRLALVAAGCGPVKAAAVDGEGGAVLATDIALQLCPTPDGAPLLATDKGGWRLAAKVAEASGASPIAQVKLDGVEAIATASSASPTARVELGKLRIVDTAAARRFEPLSASGEATLHDGVLRGRFKTALATGVHLATVDVTHDTARGAGEATATAEDLTFVSGGLQPTSVTPLAGDVLTDVRGAVSGSATFAWGPGEAALQSRGRVTMKGLDARTPFGRVMGLAGDVELSSLAPLTVPTGQEVRVARLEAVVPLTDIRARIGFGPEGVALADASATVAKGRASLDNLVVSLDPAKPIESTLRIKSLDLAELMAAFNLSESVAVQARIDGALPFVASGGAIKFSGGKIFADGPGRLSIKREALQGAVGGGAATATVEGAAGVPAPAVPPQPVQQNAVQDFAYQALENLAFEHLDATIDSRPQGRLGLVFRLKGRHDPPVSAPTRLAVTDLVRGTAFDKPIPLPKGTPVDLTLDTSLNFDELLADYSGLSRRGAR